MAHPSTSASELGPQAPFPDFLSKRSVAGRTAHRSSFRAAKPSLELVTDDRLNVILTPGFTKSGKHGAYLRLVLVLRACVPLMGRLDRWTT
jgi:hypothetical protein